MHSACNQSKEQKGEITLSLKGPISYTVSHLYFSSWTLFSYPFKIQMTHFMHHCSFLPNFGLRLQRPLKLAVV